MKPDKGNGVVILDQKLYKNATEEIIKDTSKFEKFNLDPTLKREASRFFCKLNQKNVLMKFNMINYILLVVILDQKLYKNATEEIIKDTSKFESSTLTQP